jgi:hypothetical protein
MLARFSVDTFSIPAQVVYSQLERSRLDAACEMKDTLLFGFLELSRFPAGF